MTPETEITKELIEAVKQLNRPEWWNVGATIVAAIVAAWITNKLGKRQNELQQQQLKIQERQNELQEQQIRAQEYEVRKRLYLLLTNANREIDNFIEELDWLLWQPWHNSNEGGLNRKKAHIDKLFNDLSDSYVDYELKLSKDTFNKDGYLNILNLMSRVLQHTIDSLEKGEAHLSQGHQTIYNVNGDMVEGEIRHICSHFKEGIKLVGLYQTLKQFTELRQKVRCDNSLLEDIKAKCKID
jgi:hypothetical protein